MHMKNEDYPGLFLAADSASLSAQRTYIRLQQAYFVSLILGSVAGASTSLYPAIALILVLGLLILWLARSRRDDKTWFDCRAIAESVKTVTWRFMMNVPPFQHSGSVDEQFIEELREIRNARPDSGKAIASHINASAPSITDFMRQIRSSPFAERKQFYIDSRLRDQKLWYSRKANVNARSGTRWFWIMAGLQAIAVTIAIAQMTVGSLKFNLVPVFTTCAAVVIAWSQMKRYDELAKAYSLAAQELGELEAIAEGLSQKSDFGQLVEQVEETISREHTLWCARRDVPLEARVNRNIR